MRDSEKYHSVLNAISFMDYKSFKDISKEIGITIPEVRKIIKEISYTEDLLFKQKDLVKYPNGDE